jgi:hypothetical protein
MVEIELREKISIYFKNRAPPSVTGEDEESNEEGNYSSGQPKRSAAQVRVRDTTRQKKKAIHQLAGQQAATYLSDQTLQTLKKSKKQNQRSTSPASSSGEKQKKKKTKIGQVMTSANNLSDL